MSDTIVHPKGAEMRKCIVFKVCLLCNVFCSDFCTLTEKLAISQYSGCLMPVLYTHTQLPTLPTATSIPTASSPTHHQGRCFGCSSAATEHCITLLRALSLTPQTRRPLVQQNLIQELVEFNLRSGSPLLQREVRKLLCHITR